MSLAQVSGRQHQQSTGEPPLLPEFKGSDSHAQLASSQFYKTELCRFFPNCRKGAACPYAHSDTEVQARPDLRNTSICKAWAKGCCPCPANECKFAHGARQLRNKTGSFQSGKSDGNGKQRDARRKGSAEHPASMKKAQTLSMSRSSSPSSQRSSTDSTTTPTTPTSAPPTPVPVMPTMHTTFTAELQPVGMQVTVLIVPGRMPMQDHVMQVQQGFAMDAKMLEDALKQAMPEYYED